MISCSASSRVEASASHVVLERAPCMMCSSVAMAQGSALEIPFLHHIQTGEGQMTRSDFVDTLLAFGLLLTTASQLRFGDLPIGPGELCLVTWLFLMLLRQLGQSGRG